MPITALAIGAGVGILKNQFIDQPAYERKKALAARTVMYSPWTGLKATVPDEPNALGSALQFGATGAALGSNIQSADAQNANLNAQTDWYKQGANPSGWGAARGPVDPTFGSGVPDYNSQYRRNGGLY